MNFKITQLPILPILLLVINQIYLCESARKIRYHKALNAQKYGVTLTTSPHNTISDREGGDIFGFVSHYKSEEGIESNPEDFREDSLENGFENVDLVDDIILKYNDDLPEQPTGRNIPPRSLKPLKVRKVLIIRTRFMNKKYQKISRIVCEFVTMARFRITVLGMDNSLILWIVTSLSIVGKVESKHSYKAVIPVI